MERFRLFDFLIFSHKIVTRATVLMRQRGGVQHVFLVSYTRTSRASSLRRRHTNMQDSESNDDVEAKRSLAEAGYSPLQSAARTGNADAALRLLDGGADKDALNIFDETPLMIAAREGHVPVAETLLDAGVDFAFHGCEHADTALHLASGRGHHKMVTLLMRRGAAKDALNAFRETPMMVATRERHLAVVETLLAVDADVTSRESEFFQTALHYAADRGHDAIASALLRGGADKDSQDTFKYTPLIAAAGNGHLPFVEAMLTAGADLSRKCVSAWSRPCDRGCTALHIAASEGHDEIVAALLRGGACGNEEDESRRTPLCMAARGGHLPVVKILLKAGGEPDARSVGGESKSALDHAASRGHVPMIKSLLVDGGADVNAHHGGRSALHFAALNDRPRAVAALVEAGAETETKTLADGYAVAEEYNAAATTTTAGGGSAAIITVDRRSGSTPLLFAASGARCQAMAALLQRGAAVNARDDGGHTPLHLVCAASASHQDSAEAAVAILLRWGADETALSKDCMTPADFLRGSRLPREGDGVDRVLRLLSNATADRAWRRRGWLVVLKSRASGVEGPAMDGGGGGGGHGAKTGPMMQRQTTPGDGGGGNGDEDQQGMGLAMVLAKLGLELDGVFRKVVSFL